MHKVYIDDRWPRSVEVNDLLTFEKLGKAFHIEASAGDHETGDTCGINGLLTLLLELEGYLVLDNLLDGLGRHGSALLLNHLQVDGLRVAVKSHDEVRAEEADTLAGLLEHLSELREEGDI